MSILPQLIGVAYPDQSFSIGVVPRKKIRVKDEQYERAMTDYKIGKHGALNSCYEDTIEDLEDNNLSSSTSLLDNSAKSSRAQRGSYGKHGITRFGKKFLRNSCILLQERYGRSRLGLVTATIPAVDPETCRAVIRNWSDITRRFYQKLRRICQERGARFIYAGCTEIQEQRFEDTGLAVPHLHAVYVSKRARSDDYLFSTRDAYEAWNDSVNEVLLLRGYRAIMGVGTHKGSVKLEAIYDTAAHYIGKYMSKGAKVCQAMKDKGYEDFPKQWWTACMHTKKLFKSALVRLSDQECKQLFYGWVSLLEQDVLTYVYPIYLDIEGRQINVGLYGVMNPEFYNVIKNKPR